MQRSKITNFIYTYYLKIRDVDSKCTEQTAHCFNLLAPEFYI